MEIHAAQCYLVVTEIVQGRVPLLITQLGWAENQVYTRWIFIRFKLVGSLSN